MRIVAVVSVVAAFSSWGFGMDELAQPNRMIHKRLPAPLLKELHLTSADPTTGKDAYSPITDTLQTESLSEEFDKGHLTGPGSYLQDQQLTGPDSTLDDDVVHVPLTGDDNGTSLDSVSSLDSVTSTSDLDSLTGDSTLGSTDAGDVIGLRRGVFDVVPDTSTPAAVSDSEAEIDSVQDTVPSTDSATGIFPPNISFGGRLRGMKVRRMNIPFRHQHQGQAESFKSVSVGVTIVQAPDSESFYGYGSPYQAARMKRTARTQ